MLLARACNYRWSDLALYTIYVCFAVLLPGVTVIYLAQRRRLTYTEMIALGLPVGFAVEILSFVALSAVGLRVLLPFLPLVWLVSAAFVFRPALAAPRLGRPSLNACCGFSLLATAFVLTVISRYYAGAPMAGGVMHGVTHHDWVYLLSRAAEIKARWPLEDPSMAGAPLSYHYFLLVHMASASLVTHVSLELLGLRLVVITLGAALLAQAFLLGRAVTRTVAGGLIAAVLLLAVGEVSFRGDVLVFGNWFVDWLFVSPTFFFGMVFTGALLVWVHRMTKERNPHLLAWAVLLGLAVVGTGAKGTVVPPLLVAMGLGGIALWIATRQFPGRVVALGTVMAVGFAWVYFAAMSEWGTGAATFDVFSSARVATFWESATSAWSESLRGWGWSPTWASVLASAACFTLVLLGYFGVQVLAIWAVVKSKDDVSGSMLRYWLLLAALSYALFGQLLSLDSGSQLYLWLPIALPLAVLTSDVLVRMARAAGSVLLHDDEAAAYARWLLVGGVGLICFVLMSNGGLGLWYAVALFLLAYFVLSPAHKARGSLTAGMALRTGARMAPIIIVVAVLAVQLNHWRLRNQQGLRHWLAGGEPAGAAQLQLLRDGMEWMRANTPKDALVLSNAFTRRTLRPEKMARIDETTVDKYYYYSALAERRLWVEGPSYLRNQAGAAARLETASKFFYDRVVDDSLRHQRAPLYVLVDRSLKDSPTVPLPPEAKVFSNARIEIYEWDNAAVPPGGQVTASSLR